MLAAVLAAVAAQAGAAVPTAASYREGQVWEYRTRPQDAGSLLRIQKIENDPALTDKLGPIFHISIIGVRFPDIPLNGELAHLPVSNATLDASVVRLSTASPPFPDAVPGIDQWRSAQGGVFTITLAEIVDVVEQSFKSQLPAQ